MIYELPWSLQVISSDTMSKSVLYIHTESFLWGVVLYRLQYSIAQLVVPLSLFLLAFKELLLVKIIVTGCPDYY